MATEEEIRAYTYAAEQMWELVRGLDTAMQVHSPAPGRRLVIPPWGELTGFQQAVFCRRVRRSFGAAAAAVEAALR